MLIQPQGHKPVLASGKCFHKRNDKIQNKKSKDWLKVFQLRSTHNSQSPEGTMQFISSRSRCGARVTNRTQVTEILSSEIWYEIPSILIKIVLQIVYRPGQSEGGIFTINVPLSRHCVKLTEYIYSKAILCFDNSNALLKTKVFVWFSFSSLSHDITTMKITLTIFIIPEGPRNYGAEYSHTWFCEIEVGQAPTSLLLASIFDQPDSG